MTYRVNLYADQAFLSMVKRTIKRVERFSKNSKLDYELEEVASGIILCQSALETFLNLLTDQIEIDKKLKQKILNANFITKIELWNEYKSFDFTIDQMPWQDIKRLNSVRNWLVHFKNSDIGLTSSSGEWIDDGYNKIPKFDDSVELKLERLKSYYAAIRQCMQKIVSVHERCEEYDYLITEKYMSLLVG